MVSPAPECCLRWKGAALGSHYDLQLTTREVSEFKAREGGSLICFVKDPDGYRVELIDRSGK